MIPASFPPLSSEAHRRPRGRRHGEEDGGCRSFGALEDDEFHVTSLTTILKFVAEVKMETPLAARFYSMGRVSVYQQKLVKGSFFDYFNIIVVVQFSKNILDRGK